MSDYCLDCAHEVLDVVPLVMRFIREEMRAYRGPNISVPQFRALLFIRRGDGVSLSELAEHLGLTLPSTSTMVDNLFQRGLLTRNPVADDRRRLQLHLTEQGSAILDLANDHTLAYLADVLGRLSEKDQEAVTNAMRILRGIFTGETAAHIGPEGKLNDLTN